MVVVLPQLVAVAVVAAAALAAAAPAACALSCCLRSLSHCRISLRLHRTRPNISPARASLGVWFLRKKEEESRRSRTRKQPASPRKRQRLWRFSLSEFLEKKYTVQRAWESSPPFRVVSRATGLQAFYHKSHDYAYGEAHDAEL